jgi:hypothetical protein
MPWWGWLLVGLVVGATAGVFVAALCSAAAMREGM